MESQIRQFIPVEHQAAIEDHFSTHRFGKLGPIQLTVFGPLGDENRSVAILQNFVDVLAHVNARCGIFTLETFDRDRIVRLNPGAAFDQFLSNLERGSLAGRPCSA